MGFCILRFCIVDLTEIMPEDQSTSQHDHKYNAKQGTQHLHSLSGQGIFSFHSLQNASCEVMVVVYAAGMNLFFLQKKGLSQTGDENCVGGPLLCAREIFLPYGWVSF